MQVFSLVYEGLVVGVGPGDEGDNMMDDDEADEEMLGSIDTDKDVRDVSFHF